MILKNASDVYEILTSNHPLSNSPSQQPTTENLVGETVIEPLEKIVENPNHEQQSTDPKPP